MASILSQIGTGSRHFRAGTGVFFNGTGLNSRQATLDRSTGNYAESPDRLHQTQNQWTQDDQDHVDNEAHRQAMDALVQSWMERLSLITVITTFFAATEAQLLSSTLPDDKTNASAITKVTNAGLSGALVVHVYASIISFLGAFFLVRYKVREAVKQELKVEGAPLTPSSTFSSSRPGIFSRNPHLVQMGPFAESIPPINLLRHCHTLCIWLAAIGFVLALMGVICFSWQRLPFSVSVFSSVCGGACFVASCIVIGMF